MTWLEPNTIQSWMAIEFEWTASWKQDGLDGEDNVDTRHPDGAALPCNIDVGFGDGDDVFDADSIFVNGNDCSDVD